MHTKNFQERITQQKLFYAANRKFHYTKLLTHIVVMNRELSTFISRPTCSTINSYLLNKSTFQNQFIATTKLTKILH